MFRRAAPLLLSTVFMLATPGVFAQAPPPEVDHELRARVTEFFQDFVDSKFRQALSLVAEDTQDEYFGSPKMEMKAFKIDGITYSSDFTKAHVNLTVKKIWRLRAEGFMNDTLVDNPMDTFWKIENGKWVWSSHEDKTGPLWLTPMGPSAEGKGAPGKDVPKKFDQVTMDSMAMQILNQRASSVTPNQVTFEIGKPSSVKLTFHNGVPGSVGLTLDSPPRKLGLSMTSDHTEVHQNEDATIEVAYNPLPDDQSVPSSYTLALTLEPFKQLMPVEVLFVPAKQ